MLLKEKVLPRKFPTSLRNMVRHLSTHKYLKAQHARLDEKIEKTISLILKTPAFKCNPCASPEIHTLTCKRDLAIYILAIKSLLRFYSDVAIIAHDDGSISGKDKGLLKHHIKGIRIIDRKRADRKMSVALKEYPHSKRYRKQLVNSLQLFDFIAFSRREKLISLDSDVLFFKKPKSLISWLSNSEESMLVYPEDFSAKTNKISGKGIPLCIGLMCFYKNIFDAKLAEKVLLKTAPKDWWTSQEIYRILARRKSRSCPVYFFNTDKYQDPIGFKKGAVFRHYWFNVRVPHWCFWYLRDSRRVIDQINGRGGLKD